MNFIFSSHELDGTLFRIGDILVWTQILGSIRLMMAPDPDPDPDPVLFVSGRYISISL
jgi:hypothetical protein